MTQRVATQPKAGAAGRVAALALLALTALPGCAAIAVPLLAGGAMLTGVGRGESEPSAGESFAPQSAPAADPAPRVFVQTAPALIAGGAVPLAALPPLPGGPLGRPARGTLDPAFGAFAAFSTAAARALGTVPEPAARTAGTAGTRPLSALLEDPVALDGARLPCLVESMPAVLIDLDPAGGLFAAEAQPPSLPEHAVALARLRDAGIAIIWISENPASQAGAIRSALAQSLLDPRGSDVLVLAGAPDSRKQTQREALAATSCILAIAGDEKPDFDERYRYLRNPAAGARLDLLIGDGPWFLIRNLFPSTASTGPSEP